MFSPQRPSTPAQLTIARRAASIRRTSTLDMNRPDGLPGDVVLTGIARDLLTGADVDAPATIEGASLHGRVAFHDGRRVLDLTSSPAHPGLASLAGLSAATGFRGAALRALPEQAAARTPLHLLVDEVPVGVLVSGFAMHRGELGAVRGAGNPAKPDLCAGWQRGGTMMLSVDTTGRTPVPPGTPAPAESYTDLVAWHTFPALQPHGVRRRRRLDLVARDVLEVDAVFRDSYRHPDGGEIVIHEYGLTGTIEPGTLRILSLRAAAHVLPWPECPQAAASAEHLVGRTVHDLRREVRAEFLGVSTCTHLNDMLRSLEDVAGLAPQLEGA